MTPTTEELHAAVARMMRHNSKLVKSMGDNVGANDMTLSNRLWSVAADLKEYARRWEAKEADDDPR